MLTTRGLGQAAADQVHLALQAQLLEMIANDLQYVLVDENGRRVCEMALACFSDACVALADTLGTASAFAATVPDWARARVLGLAAELAATAEDTRDLPPLLDLAGPADPADPADAAFVQFRDLWCVLPCGCVC